MKLGGILPGSQFLLPPNPAIYCLNPWLTVPEWQTCWFPVFARKFTLGSACSCLCRWWRQDLALAAVATAPPRWLEVLKVKFPLGLTGAREWCWLCECFNKCSLRAGLQKAQESASGLLSSPKPRSQSLLQPKVIAVTVFPLSSEKPRPVVWTTALRCLCYT